MERRSVGFGPRWVAQDGPFLAVTMIWASVQQLGLLLRREVANATRGTPWRG